MSRARRAGSYRNVPIVLIGTVTVLALTVVGMLIADRRGSDSTPDTSAAAGQQGAEPGHGPSPQVAAAATAAQACTAEVAAAQRVVDAARIAAGHWREHVQARTDLLSGKNSTEVTKAIWKRTRLTGPADLARLSAAASAQQPTSGACTAIRGAAGTACRHRVAVLGTAAQAGRAASLDWQRHLEMMAAHKAGEFGNEHAQDLWVSAWRTAPANLNAFARAEATLRRTGGCTPS
jgi:hypothetical protein